LYTAYSFVLTVEASVEEAGRTRVEEMDQCGISKVDEIFDSHIIQNAYYSRYI
jgi:hypothetical protein